MAGELAPRQTDPLDRALAVCFGQLNRREQTAAQLRARLARSGTEPHVIEQALTVVTEQGYVDDAGYAARYVADRRALDGWGAERIRERLVAAGIAREEIDAALGDRDMNDELEAAVAVLQGRLAEPPRSDRERNRALGLLVRRGYESDIAYAAIRCVERDWGAPADQGLPSAGAGTRLGGSKTPGPVWDRTRTSNPDTEH